MCASDNFFTIYDNYDLLSSIGEGRTNVYYIFCENKDKAYSKKIKIIIFEWIF